MVQNLYKNWLLVSKIIRGIWITSSRQWKVQKIEIQWDTFVWKIHSFQLKHYIQRIYLTLLPTTCVKIHQIPYMCHFWNHKSFFTTQLVCIILVQIFYTFDENISSKFTFSDFSLLKLKYIKFLMSFFKQKVSFSSKFGSLFSVMRDNSSAFF